MNPQKLCGGQIGPYTHTHLVVGGVHVGAYSLQKFQGLHVVRSCGFMARCFALKQANVGGGGGRVDFHAMKIPPRRSSMDTIQQSALHKEDISVNERP